MAYIKADRIKEVSDTNGQGTMTVAGAVFKYRPFSAVMANSDTTDILIEHGTLNQWEICGTVYSGGTLTRGTIKSSSNNNNRVNFSDGVKYITMLPPADSYLRMDTNGDMAITRDLAIGRNLSVVGTLGVTGATILSSTLSVGGALNMNNQRINNLLDPVSSQDAATKFYVDATVQGLDVKQTARVATTAALPTVTYNNGAGTLTASAVGILTVDGVNLVLNDIVLVKNQASASQNGLYMVTTQGTAGVAFVLTRTSDFNLASEIPGAFVPVGNAGTVNANSLWLCNPSGAVTLGTTNLPFTQLNGATQLLAGTGINISGNTISLSPVTGTGNVVFSNSPTLTGTLNAATINSTPGLLQFGGVNVLRLSTIYNVLSAPNGTDALIVGNATDPANYYRNTSHLFQTIGGATNILTMTGSAATLSVPTSISTASHPSLSLISTDTNSWKSVINFQHSAAHKWVIGVDINDLGQHNFFFYDAVTGGGQTRLLLSDTGATVTGALAASSTISTSAAGGVGYSALAPGGASNAGYVAFFDASNVRVGYVGWSPVSVDYVAEKASSYHRWYGPGGTEWASLNGGDLNIKGDMLVVNNNGMVQHDGTSMYVRPTNAGSTLWLGAANANYVSVSPTGQVSINAATSVVRGLDVIGSIDNVFETRTANGSLGNNASSRFAMDLSSVPNAYLIMGVHKNAGSPYAFITTGVGVTNGLILPTKVGIGGSPAYALDVLTNENTTSTILQYNASTTTSGVSLRQDAGGKVVERYVSNAGAYLHEYSPGSTALTRYSDFNTHYWRNSGGADVMTLADGHLTVAGTVRSNRSGSEPGFVLSAAAGNGRYLRWLSGSSLRWDVGVDAAAEAGSNAGSDFFINRFSDTGTYLNTVLSISRATGLVTFATPPIVQTATAGDNSTKAASTAFVQTALTAIIPTGTLLPNTGFSAPTGFLLCDGSAVSRTTYAALFNWLTRSSTVTITIASPAVITWTAHPLVVGDKVSFETAGALPTGLSVGTNYYVVSTTTNTFQVSATPGGAAVNTSGTQSGTQTCRHNPWGCGNGTTTFNLPDLRGRTLVGADPTNATSRLGSQLTTFPVLGAAGGAATHTLTSTEMPVHNHGVTDPTHGHAGLLGNNDVGSGTTSRGVGWGDGDTAGYWQEIATNFTGISINNAGGGGAHNNVQPSAACHIIIKT